MRFVWRNIILDKKFSRNGGIFIQIRPNNWIRLMLRGGITESASDITMAMEQAKWLALSLMENDCAVYHATNTLSLLFFVAPARKVMAEEQAKRTTSSGMEMSPGSGMEIIYPSGSNSPRPMQVRGGPSSPTLHSQQRNYPA